MYGGSRRGQPLNVLVVLGSTRQKRNCDRLATFITKKFTKAGLEVTIADPKQLKLPFLENPPHYYRKGSEVPEKVKKINQMVADADCYVLLAPEYNKHAPPAILNTFDFVTQKYAGFKTSAIVTYTDGSVPGPTAHAQLRNLMVEFGAPPIPFMFTIPYIQSCLDPDGGVLEDRVEKQFCDMFTQLEWFATATRNHRYSVGVPKWGYWMSGPSDKTSVESAVLL